DFDRDGRVDLMLPSWFEDVPNRLFRNATPGGHWLTVKVSSRRKEQNTQGIGAIVRAYAAGHLGDFKHLLGRRDIVVGVGYASGEESLAHLGLGSAEAVDLRIDWGGDRRDFPGVPTDQFLTK